MALTESLRGRIAAFKAADQQRRPWARPNPTSPIRGV
jgi:hypothetical protein